MIVSLLIAIWSQTLQFSPVVTLEPPPADQDLYLQFTLHVEIDDTGTYYIPDYPSGRVFMWDKAGKYVGFFGEKGEGPGEFTFAASLGGPRGYVYAFNDRLYVYDGGNRTISEFKRDRSFVRRIILQGLGGMINNFQVTGPNQFLFYDSYFCEDHACRRIDFYNGEGNVYREIIHDPDTTWSRDEAKNRVNLFIFEPTLALDYSPGRSEIVYAQTKSPDLHVLDAKGNALRALKLEIPRVMVQQDDIDEFNEQDWMQGNPGIKAIFPKEKAWFDRILTLKEGYLVFHLSHLYRRAKGYLVDFDGKVKARFAIRCGEGGGLFDPRERLVAVIVDEEGDFQIRELEMKIQP